MHRHSKANSEFKVSLGFQMRQWEATGSQRLTYGSFYSRMPIMPVGLVCGSKRRVKVELGDALQDAGNDLSDAVGVLGGPLKVRFGK